MTYPPQQPGQSSYQGLGTYTGGPPKKPNKGRIIAIVAIVTLVLAGGGVATYFLTKGDDKSSSSEQSSDSSSKDTGSNDGSSDPSDDVSSDRDQDQGSDKSDASNTPDDVRDDYMAAYENKDFADVVNNACAAYKKKFGTDTSSLESDLADYDITASPDGDVEVDSKNPDTATAKIDLELVGTDQTYTPKILIKIVDEKGKWRFCGEDKA
jgi:cytoskeletal protein RodZ